MMRTQKFWTRIYQKNIGKMVGASYRYVGDRAVAEDLAHEAFLKAIEKSDTYRRLGGFEAWLMRINLNTTLDYLRRQPQFVPFAETDYMETQDLASSHHIDADSVEPRISASDLSESEILDAICALPERQRAVFNLYVFEKQSHAAIAETLKIGLRSSKRYLAEARTCLQVKLTNTLQHKKSGLMILLPFLPRKAHAIDLVCRAKLSHFAIAPAKASPLAAVKWTAMPKMSPWLALSAAKAPAIAIVGTSAAIAGSVAAWQAHPADPATEHPDPTVVETMPTSSLPSDTLSISDDVETFHCVETFQETSLPMVLNANETSLPIKSNNHPEPPVKETKCSASPLPDIIYMQTHSLPLPSSNHSLITIELNGFYGLADKYYQIVVYPKYSAIGSFDAYVYGWAMVSVFGFKGFVDTNGREVVPPQYDEIGIFGMYKKDCALVRKGGFYGFIDKTGKEVVPLQFTKRDLEMGGW